MKACAWLAVVAAGALAGLAGCAGPSARHDGAGDEDTRPQRRTPLVAMIETRLPGVVDLKNWTSSTNGVLYGSVGSGVIVHPDGYILTCSHCVVTNGDCRAWLSDGTNYPYRPIARSSDSDWALIKIDPPAPVPAVPVGRSGDLMLGETVLAMGNPGGLSHSVSKGIVSALNRGQRDSQTPGQIQTDAAIDGGSSGGPLFNAPGELIGIVQSKTGGSGNIGFCVPIDLIRIRLARVLAVEMRYGFTLGLDVDTTGRVATVTRVGAGSPAEAAGVRVGDGVTGVGGRKVVTGFDFYLALVERKAGETLPIDLKRGRTRTTVRAVLGEYPALPAATVAGATNGLAWAMYEGAWEKLPDFSKLQPAASGISATCSATVCTNRLDDYGLRFTGYLQVPTNGFYTFWTSSDDGSRLWIGDQLIVDNDGLHPPAESSGYARLQAGLQPIRVEFFEHLGGEALTLGFEGPGFGRQEIPAAALFVVPAP